MTLAVWVQAQQSKTDEVRRLGDTVTGNQVEPKVMYLVPWQDARDNNAIPYQPIRGQTDSLFNHVERSEHRRHLKYLRELAEPEAGQAH